MPVQMAGHVDVLEQRESLRRPLVISAIAHAAFFASIALYASMEGSGLLWGDPHAVGGGGAVGITEVSQIPLPGRASGQQNPLADDTESRVPRPPKPQPRAVKPPEPDAIPLRARKADAPAKPKPARQTAQQFRPQADAPNQLYSSAGQRLTSGMYGQAGGMSGRVGVGPRGSFGHRYGWYSALLEQRVAQKWRTDEVDPRVQTAPPVIITFEILRDGSARSVRILQSSGNRTLDYSAQRAIYEASPFPPLPQDFERNSAQIEFWFHLKR
ncbi:MAG TPA: TonB family protein [Bryobacteraceae bacterium]|nr:TonB family protein [Bryobacteraceae bacterium]